MEAVGVFMVGISIIWIVVWAIRNDTCSRIVDQRGLFRMRVPRAEEPLPPARRRPGAPPAPGRQETENHAG